MKLVKTKYGYFIKANLSKLSAEYLAVIQMLIVAVIEMRKKGKGIEIMIPIPDEIALTILKMMKDENHN